MKFIFIDPFNIKWNGNIARNKNGISGSHNALMYLAEGIAKHSNNNVEIVSITNNIIEDTYLNVKYTNFDNFLSTSCNYIITVHDLCSLSFLNKIHNYNKIIILTQNDLVNYNELLNIDKTKVIIAYISEFAKINILNVQPVLNKFDHILLYNSICLNDIPTTININEKTNTLCFFACVDRGYNMVIEILNKLENYNLISNTYDDNYKHLFIKETNNNNIVVVNDSSKYNILRCVLKSKYFIYPLINLNTNNIHYDTFAYVVLESLLNGTIVIAPKIKVFEELYGDAVCYIDTDDIIPIEDLLYWRKENSNFGYPILNRYVEKIKLLDENEDLRNEYINKGLLLTNKFCNIKISNIFLDILKNIEPQQLKEHLYELSNSNLVPPDHINYIRDLKIQGFEPKVIYDIGSCVLHWTKEAKKLWPNAKYILFDAFSEAEFLYKEYDYHVGVLSDTNDKVVKFYQNNYMPCGNSYYREIGCENGKYFPENNYIEKITKTLDTLVKERNFPLPDFVKIDCQGSEVDIIKGGLNTLKNATRLIVELQNVHYNLFAPPVSISLPFIEKNLNFKCSAPLFYNNNNIDGDYGFINPCKVNKTILTIFAGRKANLEILCKYLKKALELKILDEVHFWNNTRNIDDENYVKSISNLRRTSSTDCGNYILVTPQIVDNSFELYVKASNDIHIKITNNITEYEIVLGGWNNTKSVIRENNCEIISLHQNHIANGTYSNKFKVNIVNNIIYIYKNTELLIQQQIIDNFDIKEIYFKTGHGAVGEIKYEITQNNGFYFMDTCKKSWQNYYQYYSNIEYEYEYTTILKCDDDIVFIDLNKLPNFINFIQKNDYDLVFANTINNGVSAYYQQNKYNLIPKNLMNLEYPQNGLCGSLWENGKKAETLHNYFIENHLSFLDYNYNKEIIVIPTRFSINFFGYKGKNWHKISGCFVDDEYNLTVDYVNNRRFNNVLYTDFYVSHLSFYRQVETGINSNDLIEKYNKLYKKMEVSNRFIMPF